ncbi:division/outer membrane stress-associated lipid-binding lipoprotein [Pseudocolwellia agarivorans]|uniref:division/outer membrane stress-associated lipid-binding lipoprotein n=1 Tax=Pseudocolwellia agarivorans TaxID=1911682 RepID=UPI0009879439|nr:division/outer membrane stress-associated lipid-binding lipoprotein [Pseudocolwellia agarivorans]
MRFKKTVLVLTCIGILQGCAAAAVVAIVGGASVATDNRTLGKQIDDQRIELVAHNELTKLTELHEYTNIQVVSVNGSVLAVGQSPNTRLRDLAMQTLSNINGVLKVHNQIRIGNTVSATTKSNDLWLTSKVKAALLANENISAADVKVVTENGEVFLMGLLPENHANIAVNVARNISGVSRVYKMFEYL